MKLTGRGQLSNRCEEITGLGGAEVAAVVSFRPDGAGCDDRGRDDNEGLADATPWLDALGGGGITKGRSRRAMGETRVGNRSCVSASIDRVRLMVARTSLWIWFG